MDILVAGGHGQIGQRLLRLLAEGGHRGRGLIRNPDHVADLERLGATAILCDLEHDDPRPHLGGADAIVFTAGAGPGSGPERKRTVDLGGALKLIEAASELGVARYVIVSSMGTEDAEHAGPMRPYLEAKAEADDALRTSGLDWTIVRPGHLTDVPGTGRVDAGPALGRRGDVPRDDVALVLLEVLQAPNTIRTQFELLAGDTPVREAVRGL
jgi:nucleoside-diphosphate-sugar epimerase